MPPSLAVGDSLPSFTVTADVGRMKTMAALLGDPNPIHWDPEAVRRLGMGDRPINQGPISIGYVLTMLNAWTNDPRALRRIKLRCLGSVLADEEVTAGGTVTAIRPSGEAGTSVLVDCRVWLERDDQTKVLDGSATVFFAAARQVGSAEDRR